MKKQSYSGISVAINMKFLLIPRGMLHMKFIMVACMDITWGKAPACSVLPTIKCDWCNV